MQSLQWSHVNTKYVQTTNLPHQVPIKFNHQSFDCFYFAWNSMALFGKLYCSDFRVINLLVFALWHPVIMSCWVKDKEKSCWRRRSPSSKMETFLFLVWWGNFLYWWYQHTLTWGIAIVNPPSLWRSSHAHVWPIKKVLSGELSIIRKIFSDYLKS